MEEEILAFLEPLELPKLSSRQNELLDADITVEELIEVIKALLAGKAPGPDGFTAEFFKSFASELHFSIRWVTGITPNYETGTDHPSPFKRGKIFGILKIIAQFL